MAFWGRGRRASDPPTSSGASVGFDSIAYARLAERVDTALTKSRARGRTVVAGVTVRIPAGIDPLAHIEAARRSEEPWTCFEQPARNDYALATLGCAVRVNAAGPTRFDDISAQCGRALEAAEIDDLSDDPDAPAGSGVVWAGGFSFYEEGPWSD